MFHLHRNRYTYLLARLTGLNSIFDCIMEPQFSYCLTFGLTFWLGHADPTHCLCSSSLLATYKLNDTEKLLTF